MKLGAQAPRAGGRIGRFWALSDTFGQDHLNYLVRELVEHYNNDRAHSNKSYCPPCDQSELPEWETIRLQDVYCDERLGGAIKWMRRAA